MILPWLLFVSFLPHAQGRDVHTCAARSLHQTTSPPLLSTRLLRTACEALGMQPVQRFTPRCSHQISGYLGTHARSSGIWYGVPLRPETRWVNVIRLTRH